MMPAAVFADDVAGSHLVNNYSHKHSSSRNVLPPAASPLIDLQLSDDEMAAVCAITQLSQAQRLQTCSRGTGSQSFDGAEAVPLRWANRRAVSSSFSQWRWPGPPPWSVSQRSYKRGGGESAVRERESETGRFEYLSPDYVQIKSQSAPCSPGSQDGYSENLKASAKRSASSTRSLKTKPGARCVGVAGGPDNAEPLTVPFRHSLPATSSRMDQLRYSTTARPLSSKPSNTAERETGPPPHEISGMVCRNRVVVKNASPAVNLDPAMQWRRETKLELLANDAAVDKNLYNKMSDALTAQLRKVRTGEFASLSSISRYYRQLDERMRARKMLDEAEVRAQSEIDSKPMDLSTEKKWNVPRVESFGKDGSRPQVRHQRAVQSNEILNCNVRWEQTENRCTQSEDGLRCLYREDGYRSSVGNNATELGETILAGQDTTPKSRMVSTGITLTNHVTTSLETAQAASQQKLNVSTPRGGPDTAVTYQFNPVTAGRVAKPVSPSLTENVNDVGFRNSETNKSRSRTLSISSTAEGDTEWDGLRRPNYQLPLKKRRVFAHYTATEVADSNSIRQNKFCPTGIKSSSSDVASSEIRNRDCGDARDSSLSVFQVESATPGDHVDREEKGDINNNKNVSSEDIKKLTPASFSNDDRNRLLNALSAAVKPDDDGDLPLHIAVVKGSLHAVDNLLSLMLQLGVSINSTNLLQQTPLQLAVITNQFDIMRRLISANACVRRSDREGNGLLHLAVKYNSTDCLRVLLADKGRLLTDNCHGGHGQVYGGNQRLHLSIDELNYEGLTALHLAVQNDRMEALRFLLSCPLDVDATDGKNGRSALYFASEQNNIEAARLLVDHGADVNLPSYSGCSPAQMASARSHSELIKLFERGVRSGRLETNEGNCR